MRKKTATAEPTALTAARQDFKEPKEALSNAMPLMSITTLKAESEVQQVGAALVSLKKARKILEDKRKSYVGPLGQVVKKINSEAKPVRDEIDKAVEHYSQLLIDFSSKEQTKLLKKVEREAKDAEKDGAMQLARQIRNRASRTKVLELEGLSVRSMRKAHVYDITALCASVVNALIDAAAVTPNMTFLNALAKVTLEDSNIPGVEFTDEISLAAKGG